MYTITLTYLIYYLMFDLKTLYNPAEFCEFTVGSHPCINVLKMHTKTNTLHTKSCLLFMQS